MVRVAPIKLQVGPKVLWFDPTDLDIRAGDDVIVNTSRGLEYGIATSDVLEVSDDLVKDLKSPLKEVVRLATPEDMDKVRELEEKSAQALGAFKEIALESNKDMHPVLVEYLFEGDKAVFYFEAEERIDFRELVRKLASYFHVRVDMRQIGVRDGAAWDIVVKSCAARVSVANSRPYRSAWRRNRIFRSIRRRSRACAVGSCAACAMNTIHTRNSIRVLLRWARRSKRLMASRR